MNVFLGVHLLSTVECYSYVLQHGLMTVTSICIRQWMYVSVCFPISPLGSMLSTKKSKNQR